MPEPTEVCGSAKLGGCRLAVVWQGGVPIVRSRRTSWISNRWDRTPGQVAEIIRHTTRPAVGSTVRSTRYREELS